MKLLEIAEKRIASAWFGFLDLLFPQNCIYCGGGWLSEVDCLCGLCRRDIAFIGSPFCSRCGCPAEIKYDYPTEDFECGLCRKSPFAFDRARSLGRYDAVLKKLIHDFKFSKHQGVLSEVSLLVESYWKEWDLRAEGFRVCPVPLHVDRLKERGFDQSFLIARLVAQTLGLALMVDGLHRIRSTDPQTKMTRTERARNIIGAFQAGCSDLVKGQNILLVDDVFTTGATVNEAARVLKKAGASEVWVFTLARA